jgi:hypothetical protein
VFTRDIGLLLCNYLWEAIQGKGILCRYPYIRLPTCPRDDMHYLEEKGMSALEKLPYHHNLGFCCCCLGILPNRPGSGREQGEIRFRGSIDYMPNPQQKDVVFTCLSKASSISLDWHHTTVNQMQRAERSVTNNATMIQG